MWLDSVFRFFFFPFLRFALVAVIFFLNYAKMIRGVDGEDVGSFGGILEF